MKKTELSEKIVSDFLKEQQMSNVFLSDGFPPESGKINWLHLWPDENLLD